MYCVNCHNELGPESRFCKYCGATQLDMLEETDAGNSSLLILALFFGIELVICLLVTYIDRFKALDNIFIFDAVSVLNTLVFGGIVFADLAPSLKWNNFSLTRLLLYMLIAIVFSIAVQFLTSAMNRNIFDEEHYYYYAFADTGYPRLLMLLVIAVEPALFEELAFRGVITCQLKKITDARQAIFITAFLFAVIHLSFLSLIWLIPFAILLGYIRERENTIWYGVFMHFCFNAVACIMEFFYIA